MDPYKALSVGEKYSKQDLAQSLFELSVLTCREGIFYCKNSDSALFFVDLEKQKGDQYLYNNFFEEAFFHWDSQRHQHVDMPKIKEIFSGDVVPHLFARVTPKVKGATQPFVYCGRLVSPKHEEGTSKPLHLIFENIDYDDYTNNDDLMDIYLWKPSKAGGISGSKVNQQGIISPKRASQYKKPNKTERQGLVTSRVGQGYYRRQLLDKWDAKCAVTGVDIRAILIASHIVPWSQSNDEEKLDVNNGILLSPNFDALFDRHLISFENDGSILISTKLSPKDIEALGVSNSVRITVSEGMIPYLERHRQNFGESR